jgi:Na+/H+ antiporter NhaD/arsenite permease-like protein
MHALGASLPLWSVAPFLGLLASIAVLPLVAPRFWHHHYPRVALGWALLFAVPFGLSYRAQALHSLLHVLVAEYLPFVLLLGALFTITGGIVVRGTLRGTPLTNVALLAAGTALASWIGTTGASMLLVRPLLRANASRRRRAHILVFFIFLVANIGGALTPLGDPPLFLGFLNGVPFFWTLRLLPHTRVVVASLLVVFYLVDRRAWRAEEPTRIPQGPTEPLRVVGWLHAALLAGVLLAVLLSGVVHLGKTQLFGIEVERQDLARDVVLVLLAALSLRFGSRALRAENQFGWGPLREVAILFAAIFVTIVPALAILAAGERGRLAPLVQHAVEPWQYFWLAVPAPVAVLQLVHERPVILEAISAGAVYMGAMTYIGNAPNFMVRSIAEESGVSMPSFFGYVARWSLPVLIPMWVLLTVVFFR